MIDLLQLSEVQRVFIYIFVTVLGLFVGSFLNVVGLRLLKEESIVFPGSHCPKCKEPIKFYDNIPIISYILLGAKCRCCKEKISIQYPIVEFSTAVLFFLVFFIYNEISIKTISMLFIIAALVVVTITDFLESYIYDITSIWLAPFGLVYNFFNLGNIDPKMRPDFVIQMLPNDDTLQLGNFFYAGAIHLNGMFVSGIIGIILSYIFFEGLSKLAEVIWGQPGFGLGDTKFCAGLSAWFGWEMLIVIILISFVAQLFVGFPLIMYNMYQEGEKRSFLASIGLVVSIVILGLSSILPLKIGTSVSLGILLFCSVAIILCLIVIFKGKRTFTYMPLGPALVIGALFVVYYHDLIFTVFFLNNPLYMQLV